MFSPLAITCMFNRPKVSELFLTNMDRVGIPIIAAVSDGASGNVCKGRCDYFYFDNSPLGAKFNEAIKCALDYTTWTHLIITGDDDLYSDDFLHRCEEFGELPFLGLRRQYMIDSKSQLACLFEYPVKPGLVLGSGRCIKRDVVEQIQEMFDPEQDRGLDHYADLMLIQHGYMPFAMDFDNEVLCAAVKSDFNLWSYDNFKQTTKFVAYDKATEFLTEREKRKLHELRKVVKKS